ncbi:hypothetical protein ACUIJP_04630 [Leuconostoc pseudomesenteroides]|uniref:hypothetical protein n=1 Tax=Leuconostoc pseudomesenteroides TaxID=33968 RepID=UPI00403DFA73
MALSVSKSISLRGTSSVTKEDGTVTQIAMFDAQISTNNAQSYNNMNIMDQALYVANKAIVRADKSDFDDTVWAAEDAMATEE